VLLQLLFSVAQKAMELSEPKTSKSHKILRVCASGIKGAKADYEKMIGSPKPNAEEMKKPAAKPRAARARPASKKDDVAELGGGGRGRGARGGAGSRTRGRPRANVNVQSSEEEQEPEVDEAKGPSRRGQKAVKQEYSEGSCSGSGDENESDGESSQKGVRASARMGKKKKPASPRKEPKRSETKTPAKEQYPGPRAPSAYVIFGNEKRNEIMEINPSMPRIIYVFYIL
jgi:hypothetical protein